MKYDIFISYRRDGGEYTAKMLRDKLTEMGYKVFFDVEALRSGDFNTELYSVIENCKDFIIVLSPKSLDRCENESDWVRKEIEHAIKTNKNIVPVLLRGFVFPKKLPEAIDCIRYKNGLEANTQLFDAFVDKLCEFLKSKPRWSISIILKLLKKVFPLFIAVLLVAVIALGAFFGVKYINAEYPRTKAEKSITEEVLYYVGLNLTAQDIMGNATSDAFEAAHRFVSTGSKDRSTLKNTLDVSLNIIENVDLSGCDAERDFITRLSGAPFAIDDIIALGDVSLSFRKENLNYINYIEYITDEDTHLQDSLKLQIIECYQKIFEEYLLSSAFCTNELLLPITDDAVLEEFMSDSFSELSAIPLRSSAWLDNADIIHSELEASNERAKLVINDLSTLVGNINIENEVLRRSLIDKYVALGVSESEAQKIIEDSLEVEEILNKIRKDYKLQPGDDADTVWWKMMVFLSFGLYDEASECACVFGEVAADSEPDSQKFLPSVNLLISNAAATGIDYGVVVTGYAESENRNVMLDIGDIIIGFDGEACHTLDEYFEMKNSLTGKSYTLTVLRNQGERFSIETVCLTTDMPLVYLMGIAY